MVLRDSMSEQSARIRCLAVRWWGINHRAVGRFFDRRSFMRVNSHGGSRSTYEIDSVGNGVGSLASDALRLPILM